MKSHSMPTWFFKDKKSFLSLMMQGHHQNHFPHFWCAAGPGVQEDLIASDPKQFFRPPYVGSRGWLGVRLDGKDRLAPRGATVRGGVSGGLGAGLKRPQGTPQRFNWNFTLPPPPRVRMSPGFSSTSVMLVT